MRDLPKVSPYLHVPAQSGSDAVLRRMKRGYTVELYREMLARIREMIPARGDHQRFHRRLLRRDGGGLSADGRAGAGGAVQEQLHFQVQPPARHAGRGTLRGRRARGGQAAAEQRTAGHPERRSAWRTTSRCLGRTVEILVEGPSKVAKKRAVRQASVPAQGDAASAGKDACSTTAQLVGRTVCDRIVVFDGPAELTGRLLPVVIERVDAFTLFGRCVPENGTD